MALGDPDQSYNTISDLLLDVIFFKASDYHRAWKASTRKLELYECG